MPNHSPRMNHRKPRRPMARVAIALFLGAAGAAAGDVIHMEYVSSSFSNIGGSGRPTASADGRFVAFQAVGGVVARDPTDSRELYAGHIYLRDRATGALEFISLGYRNTGANSNCGNPVISGDGRFVAYTTSASNLVPGDTNGQDVFVRDRVTRTTERVSVTSSGAQVRWGGGDNSGRGVAINADGRFVAFVSDADDLVPGDTNASTDVFVRDRVLGTTERVSVSSSGVQGNDWCSHPAISADGRFVAFNSYARNLVPGDTNERWDCFLRDRLQGTTERVSVSSRGVAAVGSGGSVPAVSADGRFVAFVSDGLVAGDTNGYGDIYVRDRANNTTSLVSLGPNGTPANGHCEAPSISADGRFVLFVSHATNFAPGDTNNGRDIFVRDRARGTQKPRAARPG
jgi:Tol biopolymer transport system component